MAETRTTYVRSSEVRKGIASARGQLREAMSALDRGDLSATYALLERAQHDAFDTRALLMNGGKWPATEGRFQPCTRCGESPARHNPHPANDGYVGHEYAGGTP